MKSVYPDVLIAGVLAMGLVVSIDHLTPKNPVEGYEHLLIAAICFAIVKAVHWMLTQFSNAGNAEKSGE
ncbi:MAG: hypothetical protein HZA04_09190 [Nitrospinae bacterium]|nr:hypothetical protein [Nitrospinota bacterium]